MREHDSIEFKELVATARRFCGLIDGIPGSDNWLEQLSRILPRLHAEVAVLPDPGGTVLCVETADFDDRFDLFSELRVRLGERDMYWLEYDNPNDVVTGDEHRTGSLADDLTDIYFELKRGLELLEAAPVGDRFPRALGAASGGCRTASVYAEGQQAAFFLRLKKPLINSSLRRAKR